MKSLAGVNIVGSLAMWTTNALIRNADGSIRRRSCHTDYRRMLENQKDIDAVVVATPDHTHAVITMMAIKLGKHVHCQKPLNVLQSSRPCALGNAARALGRRPPRWGTRVRRARNTV